MKKLDSALFGRLCYGYCKDANGDICLDESEAKVVFSIFEKYREGYSLGGIVDWLYEQGIPSPSGKERWTRAAVDKLLSNKSYAPHILSIEQFMDTQIMKLDRSNMERDDNWDSVRKKTRYNSKKALKHHVER